tara:strand:- start:1844 stop:2461 length:618 start_codon:yes stop_codon:yes gene_type:complete
MNYAELIEISLKQDKEGGFDYTYDWFHGGIKYDFDNNIKIDKNEEIQVLEIGAFEGKSTVWLSEMYLNHYNSRLLVVDPFLTTDKTTNVVDDTINRFYNNISKSKNYNQIIFYKDLSENMLSTFFNDKKSFDIIFIDGSHLSRDIILDIVLSWKMLKTDGYLVMDDYNNTSSQIKACLDFWLNCLDKNEYNKIFDKYQVIIKKLK